MNLEKKLIKDLQDNEEILHIAAVEDLQKEHAQRKASVKTAAGYVAPTLDAASAKKIIKEFGLKTDKVLLKRYAGKDYVIFKGYPGKREVLKGTRYLAENPKVVRFAIGPKGIAKSARGGFAITFVLSSGIEILDYVLRDNACLAELLGTISGDFIKIGLSSVAGLIAGLAIGSTAILGSVAAAPLIAAVAVGVATGLVLEAIDSRLGATQALIRAYKEIGMDLANMRYEFNRNMNHLEKNPHLIRCLFAPCGGIKGY